jgi:hypothetical protein
MLQQLDLWGCARRRSQSVALEIFLVVARRRSIPRHRGNALTQAVPIRRPLPDFEDLFCWFVGVLLAQPHNRAGQLAKSREGIPASQKPLASSQARCGYWSTCKGLARSALPERRGAAVCVRRLNGNRCERPCSELRQIQTRFQMSLMRPKSR